MFVHLFDDHHLRARHGYVATPGPVQKLGPVADTDPPAGDWALDAFSGSVLPRPGGGYRAYVTAFHRDREQFHKSRPFICESDDGLAWTRRGHVQPHGMPAGFHGYIKQPSIVALDDGRYRMYAWFHGERRGQSIARLATAVSEDGCEFHVECFDEPVLYHINELKRWGFEPGLTPTEAFAATAPGDADDTSRELASLKRLRSNDSTNIFRDPRTGAFVLYGVLFLQNPEGSPRREERDNARSLLRIITRRTSDDGLRFSDPEVVLVPDEHDPLDQQFYYLSLHEQDGYRFGLLGDYEVAEQSMDLGLAVSRDGRAWTRPMRSPLIPRDPDGFDSMSVYASDNLIDAGDDWLILYRGGRLPHNVGSRSHQEVTMALARIGKRRLIGLDTAGNRQARLLTRTLFARRPHITLDADVRGSLRAEICDAFGNPVPGYRREDAVPVRGDSRCHRLQWKDKATAPFQYEPLSLRIEATDATLFALQI